RKRIFATLVLINQVVAIGDFIQEGLYDMHLPFYLPDQKLDLHGDVYRLSNPEEDNTKIPIPLFSGWKSLERENFEKYQWQFLAPFFDVMSGENSRPLHYVLEDSRILPFIEDLEGKGPEPVISGGYSEVWRVKIHPAHHSNSSQTNPDFAVKRLRPSDRSLETFKREVATLKRLSRQDHLYLMRLQLTYLWRGNYHLLFDWADGNLKNFWEMHPSPGDIPRSHEFAIWVAEQLLGLTQGLKAIHSCPPDLALEDGAGEDEYAAERTRGRHGDLKPENILWFKQNQQFQCNDNQPHHLGRLVISDFGLTQFHRLVTGRVDPVNVARTPTYRPPEYDIGDEITQSFDIWTWGCVLLEFSIWYLKGFKAWDGFSRERTE
ncbi:kinase-like protein, partial [Cryphonectria parasitica EP155]